MNTTIALTSPFIWIRTRIRSHISTSHRFYIFVFDYIVVRTHTLRIRVITQSQTESSMPYSTVQCYKYDSWLLFFIHVRFLTESKRKRQREREKSGEQSHHTMVTIVLQTNCFCIRRSAPFSRFSIHFLKCLEFVIHIFGPIWPSFRNYTGQNVPNAGVRFKENHE